MPVKFKLIDPEVFREHFTKFYRQCGEYIGPEGHEYHQRYMDRLEVFYETFKVYRIERVKEAFLAWLQGHSTKEGFPLPGDLWDELQCLPEPVTKIPERVLTEEDHIANQKLQDELRDIMDGKKSANLGGDAA